MEQFDFSAIIRPSSTDGMANSVDPDKTAPLPKYLDYYGMHAQCKKECHVLCS